MNKKNYLEKQTRRNFSINDLNRKTKANCYTHFKGKSERN